jgi:hypothetical protein
MTFQTHFTNCIELTLGEGCIRLEEFYIKFTKNHDVNKIEAP